MAVTIKLPTQLRGGAGGAAEASADGATVGEVLEGLYDQHGGLRVGHRRGNDGELRRFVNVYLKGEDIRFLDGLATPVADGDEVADASSRWRASAAADAERGARREGTAASASRGCAHP